MKPTLELDNLSVGYGRRVLLKDLCASILPGQILTLIGPNGAGKSTILKTISHHLARMGGVVRVGGEDIEQMDGHELAKRLSVVLTERVRPELMTCYDVAASGRYPYTGRFGMLTAQDRNIIAQSLALVHAEELADKPFARVSDGQRQRVMIARAICQQPRVLVLDEPTSFLDIRYKIELSAILLRLAREQGVTIVMSLHEIDLAARVSDLVMGIGTHGVEMFGAAEPVADAQIIAMALSAFKRLGLEDVGLQLNSIGRSAPRVRPRRHGARDGCLPPSDAGRNAVCNGYSGGKRYGYPCRAPSGSPHPDDSAVRAAE